MAGQRGPRLWPKRGAACGTIWRREEPRESQLAEGCATLFLLHRLAELVAARRQKGTCAEVREVRWQVSEHVGHLRKHPEEYTAALLGFLKSCTTV